MRSLNENSTKQKGNQTPRSKIKFFFANIETTKMQSTQEDEKEERGNLCHINSKQRTQAKAEERTASEGESSVPGPEAYALT